MSELANAPSLWQKQAFQWFHTSTILLGAPKSKPKGFCPNSTSDKRGAVFQCQLHRPVICQVQITHLFPTALCKSYIFRNIQLFNLCKKKHMDRWTGFSSYLLHKSAVVPHNDEQNQMGDFTCDTAAKACAFLAEPWLWETATAAH